MNPAQGNPDPIDPNPPLYRIIQPIRSLNLPVYGNTAGRPEAITRAQFETFQARREHPEHEQLASLARYMSNRNMVRYHPVVDLSFPLPGEIGYRPPT